LDLEFVGPRPTIDDIELAAGGEIDAMIRAVAAERGGRLVTSDRVQAHVARAMGLPVDYLRPVSAPDELDKDLADLEIMKYFDANTMSVHLKYNVVPMAKKGTPGDLKLVRLSDQRLELRTLTRMRHELIEAARRDADSFVEIERNGATVVQLGAMRIAIAQPPFSDGLEITAVRPVARLTIEDYAVPPPLLERFRQHQRGVFVSGPPGSGKSTFVTAVAEWLRGQDTIVKTMESPRDLQVSDEITQYAPLEKDMALTSDVLLLVRPDFVVYDEVRRTNDFEVFADMRLAGVGLVGVTHANRAIDAVQRLIGRVELGMIPQVVDTVVHIEKGRILQILELSFTVKTPFGMTEADLARPVIEVRDFATRSVEFEIYTYGEQVVVMPVRAVGGAAASAKDRLAAEALLRRLRRHVEGRCEAEFTGESSAVLYAEAWEIPRLIGRGGTQVKEIEADVGVKLDIRPLQKGSGGPRARQRPGSAAPPWAHKVASRAPRRADEEDEEDARWRDEAESLDAPPGRRGSAASRERRYAEVRPELRKTKKSFVLLVEDALAGQDVEVVAGGDVVFRATVSAKGEIRVNRNGPQGETLGDALREGKVVTVRT
ncbi:MAG TPA: PINc/VapC family ATPase, partial [Candidatus Thermoplasmatota archaeon]|nr:PINc/VapC family ATPase [Candidatus Thermoplasmatota archaeon]